MTSKKEDALIDAILKSDFNPSFTKIAKAAKTSVSTAHYQYHRLLAEGKIKLTITVSENRIVDVVKREGSPLLTRQKKFIKQTRVKRAKRIVDEKTIWDRRNERSMSKTKRDNDYMERQHALLAEKDEEPDADDEDLF